MTAFSLAAIVTEHYLLLPGDTCYYLKKTAVRIRQGEGKVMSDRAEKVKTR